MPRPRILDDGIALGLHRFDHLEHELQTLKLTYDLRLEARGQRTSIASAQFLELRPTVRPQRRVVIDALCRAKPFDAIDMLHTLDNQPLALAVEALGIFLFDPRKLRHAAGLRLATQISDQMAMDVRYPRASSLRSYVSLSVWSSCSR